MKKQSQKILFIILIILLTSLGAFLLIKKVHITEKEPSIEIEPIENTRFENLKKIIKASPNFTNSEITSNEKKDILTIDGTYDISIKSGYYQMTIKDPKLENTYCEIVDTIEQNLGLLKGKSIETCQKTLEGSINLGGISAEIYDNYKILSVNIEKPATLYNEETSHKSEDKISVEEVNHNILIDKYLLSSMKTSYQTTTKLYSVCGNIYNSNKKATNKFEIAIYDSNKKELASKKYSYQNDTKKYLPFCVDFELETDIAKYYSVKIIKEKK